MRSSPKAWAWPLESLDTWRERGRRRRLVPFAADHPQLRTFVLYYPSVRDEPETSHRPPQAFNVYADLAWPRVTDFPQRRVQSFKQRELEQ